MERLRCYCGTFSHLVAKLQWPQNTHFITQGWEDTSLPCSVLQWGICQSFSQRSFTLQVQIMHSKSVFALSILVDSRAASNFIDHDVVKRLNLSTQVLQCPLTVTTVYGGPIGIGFVTHCTAPIPLQVSALHNGSISLLVMGTKCPIILRFPFHDHQISWHNKEIPSDQNIVQNIRIRSEY